MRVEFGRPRTGLSPARTRLQSVHTLYSLSMYSTRCQENMAHIRESRPDSGQSRPDSSLGFQVRALETFDVVPSLLGSGPETALSGPTRLDSALWHSRSRGFLGTQ